MTMIGNNDVDPMRDHYIKLGKVLKDAGRPGEDFHRLEQMFKAAKKCDAMQGDMQDLMERLAPYEAPEDAPDPYDKLNVMRRENKRLRDALREAAAELGRAALAFDSKDDRAKRLRHASTRAHALAGDGFEDSDDAGKKADAYESIRETFNFDDDVDPQEVIDHLADVWAKMPEVFDHRDRLKEAARKILALTDYTLEEHGDLVPDGIVPDQYVMGRAAYDAINEAIDAARKAMGDDL